jgi:hypothetical protein
MLSLISADAAQSRAIEYCELIDEEWLETAMLANPRFFGPDADDILGE